MMQFSSPSLGCQSVDLEGPQGECGRPEIEPEEEVVPPPAPRGGGGGGGGGDRDGSDDDDFPDDGDNEGDCDSSEDESGSPVAYLTGHKVERATDISIALPGRDFRIVREYTSNPNFYYTDENGQYFWNGDVTNVEPGSAGVRWSLNTFRTVTGDIGDSTTTLFLNGQPMRSVKKYERIVGQDIYVVSGGGNSYIEPDEISSIGWLNAAGLSENGANVKVWRLRTPGQGELVFMRKDEFFSPVADELDRSDLKGVILYEIDAYGNEFEYEWTSLGTGNGLGGREIIRLDRILLKDVSGVEHARVLLDWHGESGTGLLSENTLNDSTGEWVYGRLDEIRVERPDSGNWVMTQRVQYIHYDEIKGTIPDAVLGGTLAGQSEWNYLSELYDGSDGDLCEVIVSKIVDEDDGDGDGFYDRVTQYRYYADNNNNGNLIAGSGSSSSPISDLVGLDAHGLDHQLMAVIYPQQIEYYASKVFNAFTALGSNSGDIATALGISVNDVPAVQTDLYSSSQTFGSVKEAAERLRWTTFQDDGSGWSFDFDQALLLPNGDWNSLFDLAGKFITYYSSSTAVSGETNRVRTQLISSGANGCGCGGANPTIGLGKRFDYLYRRYELDASITPPATVHPGFSIVSDGYSCLVVESAIDNSAATLAYKPYRVHSHDYYWPTSLPNGMVIDDSSGNFGGVLSRSGVRKLGRALCTADPSWGTTVGKEFDPAEDPIDQTGPMWATSRVYGNDSVDPFGTQFNNYAKVTAVLTFEAVAESSTGYTPVAGSGVDTESPVTPQQSDSGKIYTYDYTGGFLTKVSVADGIEPSIQVDVVQEFVRGGANDRPDLLTQVTRDAGDGVQEVSSFAYGYYDNTNSTDINAAIIAWTKSAMAPESPSQNGPGGALSLDYSNWTFYDRMGQLRWTRDAGGTLSYSEYDEHTGKTIRSIRDADPNDVSIPTNVRINESNFVGITAAGWSLPTRSTYDELTDIYAYDLMGRQIESTDPSGVKSYTRRVIRANNYVDETGLLVDNGVALNVVMSFPHLLSGGGFNGPVSISWQDATGSSLRSSDFECVAITGYDPSVGTYTVGSEEYSRSESELAVTGSTVRSRQWFDIFQVDASLGSFYTETRYDELGRTYQVIDPLGGVTQYGTDTVPGYDIMNRSLAMAQGVMDSGGLISVDLISETFYDSNHSEVQGIGNGLVSVTKAYTGEGTQSRSMKYWYDFRDRLIGQKNPAAPHQLFGYDILGRQIEQASWTDGNDFVEGATGTVPSPSAFSTNRSTYSKTFFNNRGMSYRQIQAIDPTMDPADQAFPGYLESFTWYDPEGQAVASWNPGGAASKVKYDHLNRPLVSYVTDRAGDLLPGAGSYESIFDSSGIDVDISDDHVLSQTESRYILGGNPGAGKIDLVTSRARLHDTNDVGELNSTNSVAMFRVSRFDDASRVTDTLNYGTNDSVSSDKFKSSTTAPATIDLNRSTSPAMISSVRFDEIGRTLISIDPEGKESLRMYDDLSRSFAVIENYQTGFEANIAWDSGSNNWSVNWSTSPPPDENRVTTFTYDLNSNVIKQTAHLNDGSVQVTENKYGVTATAGSGVMESRVSSPSMLSAVHYPNETTGLADASAAYTVSFAYNRLGELRGRTDQNGTQHAFTRDELGRVLSDNVMNFGADIDDAVAEITTGYDDHGRVTGVHSWDDAVTPVELNSVEYVYTPLHQIKEIIQNVDVDGGASDKKIEYDYINAEPSANGGNYSRLSAVRYPSQAGGATNSYELDYSGTINDAISRVNGLDVPGWAKSDALVRYTYMGTGAVVKVDYPSGLIGLDSTKGPSGSSAMGEYPALDRFGRVVWHAWVHNTFAFGQNVASVDYPNASPLMARRYAYDPITKNRSLDWDGRPGDVLDDRDWEHDYDGFDRLITSSRGQWDPNLGTPALTLASNSRQWELDMLGNWDSVATDLNGSGVFESGDETEIRTHNLANELLSREGEPGSGPFGTTPILQPTYDDAGNYTKNGGSGSKSLEYVYDAWNRLVRVERKVVGGTNFSILENEYNPVGWRVIRRMDTSDGAYDGLDEERQYYFNTGWQMVEEHVDTSYSSGSSFSKDYASQQFWGTRYIDDAVAKRIDRDNDGDWAEAADQYFYLTDAMFSVRAMTDRAGYVRERIDYTPYGVAMHRYAGDYNGDGVIGTGDLTILSAQGGGSVDPGDAGYDPHVDLNGDGLLDGTDISIFLADNAFVTTNGNGVPPDGWLGDPSRTSSDGTDNAFGYDGYWFDAAGATDAGSFGLYAVRNRVYDPGLGRWLTKDPAGFVDGRSLYQYGQSSPVIHNDPSGLKRIIVAFDGQNFFGFTGRGSMRSNSRWNSNLKARFPNDIIWHSEEDGDILRWQAGKIRARINAECRKTCKKPTVILMGHSNGGDGARKTARQLGGRNNTVAVGLLFLIDPVYKPWWGHKPSRNRAVSRNATTTIDWYQRMDPASFFGFKFQGYKISSGIGVSNPPLPTTGRLAEWTTVNFHAHTRILDEFIVYNSAYNAIGQTPSNTGVCDED
ncbi:MAG: hypothetical protein JKX70_02955 [Phycisphaerales bacterium]|nr:hypothetical protein [Phycisphaerales bacterium]